MAAQYNRGDYVRYACNGVCLIDDIRQELQPGTRKKKEFYILKPVANNGGTIFVPSDSPVLLEKMQSLPTAGEIDEILASVKSRDTEWIDDRKLRAATFQTILKECQLQKLIELVSCIYQRRQNLESRGKKLSASDETVLRRAEGLIENELSFVLQIEEKQVAGYIRGKLSISE